MSRLYTLSLTAAQHERLKRHLFPGDGLEAVAVALCGRREGDRRHRLLVREIHPIPYEMCSVRSRAQVRWPTDAIVDLLEEASKKRLSVVKIHSHPSGYHRFSDLDDESDRPLFPAVRGWVEHAIPHGSAVMLPDGEMFGRVMAPNEPDFRPLDIINVVGPDLHYWYADAANAQLPSFVASHAQAFGAGTTERLRRLTVVVVGCSGTGSPVIEQLVRLGVGTIILVDDDRIKDRNVNRIINSTMQDAREQKLKVDAIGEAINRIGLGTRVIRMTANLWTPAVVRIVAQADLLIGCMDTIDGRYLLNRLATYYTLPYFDLGIRLDAVPEGKDKGRIREICGSVHYLQPGGSSLLSRGLYTMKDVADAGLRRRDPAAFAEQVKAGYIRGVQEHRPAVISVNMYAASLAINDLLARLHPYREESNQNIASIEFSLSSLEIFTEPEGEPCDTLKNYVGKGDVQPLLHLVELSETVDELQEVSA